MRLIDLSTREQFLIYTVILLACGALLCTSMIYPGFRQMSAALSLLDSQRGLLKAKAEKADHGRILGDKVQQLKIAVSQTKELLFSRDEATDFLRLLPKLVHQTGNVLVAMKLRDVEDLSSGSGAAEIPRQERQTPEEAQRFCIRMPVQMSIRGKYDQVIQLFEQLDGCKKLITVSEINIAAVEDPTEVGAELTLNLHICEYHEA